MYIDESTQYNMVNTIKIDEKDYDADTLSGPVRVQIMHIRLIDEELMRLQTQTAIYKTARVTYANALKAELAKIDSPPVASPRKKTK